MPIGQGAATAITPQGGRTPTGLPTRNPATRPPHRPPPHPRPAPNYSSTRHTEARSPVQVKRKKPQEKKSGNKGEALNQESGGREGNQEKHYAT